MQVLQTKQKLDVYGKIVVSKKAWLVRILTLSIHLFLIIYIVSEGLKFGDLLIIYSIIIPMSTFMTLFMGWTLYKNPITQEVRKMNITDLVSIIVPVYNQESLIVRVIDALLETTYPNFEIIVVNDGSKDNTKNVLDSLKLDKKYSKVKIIHKENGGKRKAVAAGFYHSNADYLVLIDSDSIVDRNAVQEFMYAFYSDKKIGGMVGHVKVMNSDKNWITKVQDCWYDFAFNVGKASESPFGATTCLSGCLAAYRKDAIKDFIPYWSGNPLTKKADDKELTVYTFAPSEVKQELTKIFGDKAWYMKDKLKQDMAKFDDAEDRSLTAHSMITWKTMYVASAIVYTDVPEKWNVFVKQQIRWKKGFLRTNFFVNTFFWKKHPLVSFPYYIGFISAVIAPLVNITILLYVPLVVGNHYWTVTVLLASLAAGFSQGLDYKFRDNSSKHWMYKPLTVMITYHVLSWLIFPALFTYRKNVWSTR